MLIVVVACCILSHRLDVVFHAYIVGLTLGGYLVLHSYYVICATVSHIFHQRCHWGVDGPFPTRSHPPWQVRALVEGVRVEHAGGCHLVGEPNGRMHGNLWDNGTLHIEGVVPAESLRWTYILRPVQVTLFRVHDVVAGRHVVNGAVGRLWD